MEGEVPLAPPLAVPCCLCSTPPLVIKTALALRNISERSLNAEAIEISRSLSVALVTLLPTRPPFFAPAT
jgi:hypothetical protein